MTPIADTNAGTPLGGTAKFITGHVRLRRQAPGYGLTRFTKTFTAGQVATVTFPLQTNWASAASGASASGDGSDFGSLIDDTEGTAVERHGTHSGRDRHAGRRSTFGGGAHPIDRVQVSAMLQTGQNRFTALRSFEIWTCNRRRATAPPARASRRSTRVRQTRSRERFRGRARRI